MIQKTKLPTDIQDICLFFSEYVTWLMSSGATCIRMEKNVARIAEAWKVDVRMTIMPSHIMLCVWDGKHTTSQSLFAAKGDNILILVLLSDIGDFAVFCT